MKVRPIFFILFALLASSLLTACSGQGASWPGLSADEELAYVSSGPQIFAVRLSDGKEAWHFPEKTSGKTVFYATPVLTEDGQLLIGSAGSEHTFFYLDARSGAQKATFSKAKSPWMGSPLVVGDKVYAPNGDGTLYMLDMQGNKLNGFEAGGPLWSQPVTDGTYIYVGALNHNLYALNPETLEVAWKVDMGGAVPGSPALGPDGILYVGSFASKVVAVDAATGSVLWEAPTEGTVWGGPTLTGDKLYAADLTGKVYAFDAATGERTWEPIQPDGPITGSPMLFGTDLIVTTETGAVVLVGQDGKFKNLNTFQGKFYTMAVAAGDLILVAPTGARFQLTALDADGKQMWAFPPEE